MYPDNDYRDYLEHSVKGQTWKNHKYLYKDQWGRYVYPEDRYVYPEDRQEEISNKKKRSPSGNGSSLMKEVDTSKLKFKKSTGVSKNLDYGNAKKNSSLFKDLNEYSLSKRAKKRGSGISLSERFKERYKVRSKNNNESLLSKRTKNKRSAHPLSDRVKARYKSKRSS